MKRIVLLLVVCSQSLLVFSQKNAPKWADKARKSVITVTTYGKDGNKLSSGTAFYVSESGEALAAYDLFKGAEKAIIQDIDGKELPVTAVLGADELYDVIKFQVETPKKVNALPVASMPIENGSAVFMLPFSTAKQAVVKSGAISEVSNLKDNFKYYKTTIPMATGEESAPLLTAEGAVFAMTQADAGGNQEQSYGISVPYANQLAIGSTDFLNATYRNLNIRKSWPADVEQATVALYLLSSTEDAATHLETINYFINTFPKSAEGYQNRASHYAYNRSTLSGGNVTTNLQKAEDDLKTALKLSDKPAEALFNQAKLIYGIAASDSTIQQAEWTIDAALETVNRAIEADNLPVYHQLKGDILLTQENYPTAFDEYMLVNASDIATPTTFYMARSEERRVGKEC